MSNSTFDCAVVGAGHNGLAAAIALAQRGRKVVVYERAKTVGGGARTAQLTIPGFHHDVCSSIHPMAVGSFYLRSLGLENFGLEWIHPEIPLAHPVQGEPTALLFTSLDETAEACGSLKYARTLRPFVQKWEAFFQDAMGPLGVPSNPWLMAKFGLAAVRSAESFWNRTFATETGKTLFAGLAAHSFLPMEQSPSAAIGLMLALAAHGPGWPFPKGGAQRIPDAMAQKLMTLGGVIRTGVSIDTVEQIETTGPVFFETAPKHFARICAPHLPDGYRKKLMSYRHGPGVFKLDWALDGPIPWSDPDVARAGTVHLGSLREIQASERAIWNGGVADRPYVLLAQYGAFDDTRAPSGKHTAWAYCHVPHGLDLDCTEAIESQVEAVAPGFRERILMRHAMNSSAYEAYNPNFVGGDTVGGANTLSQLFSRPVPSLSPYASPNPRLFICSASTPPGGGIHGLGGYHAVQAAVRRGVI